MEDNEIFQYVADKLDYTYDQVKKLMQLLDNDNTVPFIARYRKEQTDQLNETEIRKIQKEVQKKRNLEEKRAKVLQKIDEQGELTAELKTKIEGATTQQELKDLYRPYKKKRKTRGEKARKKGLEPLAKLILLQKTTEGEPDKHAQKFVDSEEEVDNVEEALQGARDIIAENISDDAEIRKSIRQYTFENSLLYSERKQEEEHNKYKDYEEYEEPIQDIPPHRVLAINRGEEEDYLRVKVKVDTSEIINKIEEKYINNPASIFTEHLKAAIDDGYNRLIKPSIEREVRNHLTEEAEDHAIDIFAENLKNLLLQPPLKDNIIMGIDPGFKSGCKAAVIDTMGEYQEGRTIYPHPPQNEYQEAKHILKELIQKYEVDSIAIGNGTASRETEKLVADLISDLDETDLGYTIVNEAGASVYSASPLARKEFPDLEASMRGNISIARRLLDPLGELVKIDPSHIGVGQYQHDVDQKKLNNELRNVVEDCVNQVGVNLNTASSALLEYVSGLTSYTAENIVEYRSKQGKFSNREELNEVKGIGIKTFQQAAGFLRIPESDNPFDNTSIHPESYDVTRKLLDYLNISEEHLGTEKIEKQLASKDLSLSELSNELEAGEPTLKDIIKNLKKPGLDPRDKLSEPKLNQEVLSIDDLKEEMVLQGTVRNVVDFGAFVDIGVKDDGLIHISELSEDYVDHPSDIVAVGDIVKVEVLSIEEERGRIGLRRVG